MKKILLSLGVVFFASANGFAQNIPMDASVKTGTLPNGMKYYIKKTHCLKRK